ncbi:MAG TPA: hypothetical protein VH327_05585 [Gammaproteobacteria bacterium]|nr:hypothetical protein [Gammaproteobacteria bacterium]
MSAASFTLLHVIISLVGIAAGAVCVSGLLQARIERNWTALFLALTTLTDLTGYLFHPFAGTPAEIVGFISLAALALAAFALYGKHLAGYWRIAYLAGALFALYLNCFVAVIQAFGKVAALRALAPTQKEPPFLAAQVVLLLVFLSIGWFTTRRFRTAAA